MSAITVLPNATASPRLYQSLGEICAVDEAGVAFVNFPENDGPPMPARSALSAQEAASVNQFPVKVLLVFEHGDKSLPIITALVRETLLTEHLRSNEKAEDTHQVGFLSPDKASDIHVDGRRITLDAREEICIRCGKSSIMLKKDGKIVIKGSRVISRSTGANKIKGSSVNIN